MPSRDEESTEGLRLMGLQLGFIGKAGIGGIRPENADQLIPGVILLICSVFSINLHQRFIMEKKSLAASCQNGPGGNAKLIKIVK